MDIYSLERCVDHHRQRKTDKRFSDSPLPIFLKFITILQVAWVLNLGIIFPFLFFKPFWKKHWIWGVGKPEKPRLVSVHLPSVRA